jgi:hypothetical protein
MKNAFYISVFLLLSFSLSSQIVLDINDLPKPGNSHFSVKVAKEQGLQLLPGDSGANVLWDFSNLLPCCINAELSLDTIIWEDHFSTMYAASFPLANIVNRQKCSLYHSHVTHQDEKTCSYNHYIKNNAGLWYYGFESPANVIFTTKWNIFPLLSYGESVKDTAVIRIPISTDSIRVYHIYNYSMADAWGTVITPDTLVEAIRIYTNETIIDTLFVKGVVHQANKYTDNYYYRWYTKNIGFPVLDISKGMQTQYPPFSQKVTYAKQQAWLSTGITDQNRIEFEIFPNPFKHSISINPSGNEKHQLSIYNVGGQIVYSSDILTQHLINTENWEKGFYFYRLRKDQEIIVTGKMIKN